MWFWLITITCGREAKVRNYYGQEYNSTTYNLARMNMLLHDVNFKAFQIENGDTLEDPAHRGEQFDAVVANPQSFEKGKNQNHLTDEDVEKLSKHTAKGRQ